MDKTNVRRTPKLTMHYYNVVIEPVREVARECGYAIGVHGSLKRDIDLIACPWTTDAVPAGVLVAAILHAALKANDDYAFMITNNEPKVDDKPHGRMCWMIHFEGSPYIDLSVMPLLPL